MKLIFPHIDFEINISEECITCIAIENPVIFSRFLQNLMMQQNGEEGELLLVEKDTEISFSRRTLLISNPFQVDCNEKRIITSLHKEISTTVEKEYSIEKNEFSTKLFEFLEKIKMLSPYHLSYNYDFDVGTLLKLVQLKVDSSPETLSEKLIDYLRAISSICGINIVFTINIKDFLNHEELVFLYEFCIYNKIYLINIEGKQSSRLPAENHFVIDNDLCIIEE